MMPNNDPDRLEIFGNSAAPGDRGEVAPLHRPELGALERAKRFSTAIDMHGSAASVARLTGVEASTVKRIRAGQEPKWDDAVHLAEGLGIRVEWLATGRGAMRVGEGAPEPPPLRYFDFDTLATGLEIAEELQPDAPPEARITAALRAADRIRQQQQQGTATPIDAHILASCLGMIETLFGRDRPVIRRLRPAMNAYQTMMDEPRDDNGDAAGPSPSQGQKQS